MPPVQDYLADVDSDPMLEGSRQANYDSGLAVRPGTKAQKAPKAGKPVDPLDNPAYKQALQARKELHDNEAIYRQRLRDFDANEGAALKWKTSPGGYPGADPTVVAKSGLQSDLMDSIRNNPGSPQNIAATRQMQLLAEKRQRLADEADRVARSRMAFDAQHFIPLREQLLGSSPYNPDSLYTNGAGTIAKEQPSQDYLAPTGDDWVSQRVAEINQHRENTGQKPLAPGSVSAGNFTEDWAPLRERVPETESSDRFPSQNNPPGDEERDQGDRGDAVPDLLDPATRANDHQAMADTIKDKFARASTLERAKMALGKLFGSDQSIQTPESEVSKPWGVPIGFGDAGTKGQLFTVPETQGNGVVSGLARAGNKFTANLITPENAAIAAATGGLGGLASVGAETGIGTAASALKTAGTALFTGQMAKDIPASVKNAYTVYNDPNSTPAQKAEALATPGLQALMTGLVAKHGLDEATQLKQSGGDTINPDFNDQGGSFRPQGPQPQGGASPGTGSMLRKILIDSGRNPSDVEKLSDLEAHQEVQKLASQPTPESQTNPSETNVTGVSESGAQAPVDIGPRDETISNGSGTPTEAEAKMIEQWKQQIAEEQNNALQKSGSSPMDVQPASENGPRVGGQDQINQDAPAEGESTQSPEGEAGQQPETVPSGPVGGDQGLSSREDVISSENQPSTEDNTNESGLQRRDAGVGESPDQTSGLQQTGRQDPSGREQPSGTVLNRGDAGVRSGGDGGGEQPRSPEVNEPAVSGENPSGAVNNGESGNPGELNVLGIKNESVEAQRKALGLPPAEERHGLTDAEGLAQATEILAKNPNAGDDVIAKIESGDHVISGTEDVVLAHDIVKKANARDEAEGRLDAAKETGDEKAIAAATTVRDETQTAYERAMNASDKAGTKSSDSLRMRKIMLNRDYSQASLERKFKQATNGREPTETERAQLKELSEKYKVTQKALDEHLSKAEEERASHAAEIAIRDLERQTREKVGPPKAPNPGKVRQWLSERAAEAEARLKAKLGRASSGIDPTDLKDYALVAAEYAARGVDAGVELVKRFGEAIKEHIPTILKLADDAKKTAEHVVSTGRDTPRERQSTVQSVKERLESGDKLSDLSSHVRKIAEQHIREGAIGREEVLNRTHETLKEADPEITKREVQDAISGYGNVKPLNPRETLAKLRDVSGQLQQISKLEDMQKGQAPLKTGIERRVPSEEEKRLIKQVEEAKKKGGYTVTDPSRQLKASTDAISSSLDSQIRELQRQITMEEVFTPGKKEPISTPEIAAKRARVEELKAERENVRDKLQPGKEQPTPEEKQASKAAASIKAADKTIASLKAEINSGSAKLRTKASDAPTSLQLQAKRAEIENLTAHRDALRKLSQPAKTPEEIAARDLAAYKARLLSKNAELKSRLASGDVGPRKRQQSVTPDLQATKLKAANEAVKDELRREFVKQQKQAQKPWQKFVDGVNSLRKVNLISGLKTLAKIGIAGQGRAVATAADAAAGAVLNKIPGISTLAEGAPREGGTSGATAENIAKGYIDGWKMVINEAGRVLKTGLTSAEAAAGREASDGSLRGYVYNTHQLLKLPAFAQEYNISLRERMTKAAQNGPVSLLDQMRINNEAVVDGERAKFGQDNIVNKSFRSAVSSLENNKAHPDAGKVMAGVLNFLFPITKVPSNYLAEAATYSNLGLGLPRALYKTREAFQKGMDSLTPEQKDSIMRHWKKGAWGAGLMLYGFYNRNNIGGYYQPGQKNNPNKPQFGGMKIYGHDVPRLALHLPFTEPMNIGATIGHAYDQMLSKGKEPDKTDAVIAGVAGLLDESSFIQGADNAIKAMAPGKVGSKARREMIRDSVVPRAVTDLAELTDRDKSGETIQRAPTSLLQSAETSIPGLRQTVAPKSYVPPAVAKELGSADLSVPTTVRPKIGPTKRPATDEEFQSYKESSEKAIGQRLAQELPRIKTMKPEAAKKYVEAIAEQEHIKARVQLELNARRQPALAH